jgi:peptidoglycan hydrolase-like protein with peptidoglycan-binding domain
VTCNKQLVELGHKKLEVDGDFGEKTEKAVEQFQKKHKVEETGVANSKTIAAIEKALEPPKPEPKPQPAPKAAFVVTAAFVDAKPKEVNGLTTRTALNKQVGAFLDDGARFVQISPES